MFLVNVIVSVFCILYFVLCFLVSVFCSLCSLCPLCPLCSLCPLCFLCFISFFLYFLFLIQIPVFSRAFLFTLQLSSAQLGSARLSVALIFNIEHTILYSGSSVKTQTAAQHVNHESLSNITPLKPPQSPIIQGPHPNMVPWKTLCRVLEW